MSESSTMRALPSSVLLELETLRDQRDLYQSLLLAEPTPLATFMTQALQSVERIRAALRSPGRDSDALRRKIEQLQAELGVLEQASFDLHLPTVSRRMHSAHAVLREIETSVAVRANDLLPAMVVLEELCSHIAIAAASAAVHVPLAAEDGAAGKLDAVVPSAPLADTLQRLVDALALEQGKHARLATMGLEDIPLVWVGTLFEVLGQLLRNAIEHGIELPAERTQGAKPEIGTLRIQFVRAGAQDCELTVEDDGAGLDAERIAEVAVGHGLLTVESARTVNPQRLMSLIFQPGFTTARNNGGRGLGLRIARDRVTELGGRITVATKRGRFTRYRITLPSLPDEHPA
jgi:two-component system chemotaxis sensor kinase CheA